MYIRWILAQADEAQEHFIEIDDDRYEVRAVERFADGRYGWASMEGSSEGTNLGDQPTPDVAEINQDMQFHAKYISRKEFEEAWRRAHEQVR